MKVYRREDNVSSCELVHTIFGSIDGDNFGFSVSFSDGGKNLVIGAPGYWYKNNKQGYVSA